MAIPIKFDSEVVEFINKHNLMRTCFLMLSNITKIYSDLISIKIELDYWQDDDEADDDDEGHLVFRVMLESDQKTALEDYDDYVTWIVENIPPQNAIFCATIIDRG
jgi:hypothetical protein